MGLLHRHKRSSHLGNSSYKSTMTLYQMLPCFVGKQTFSFFVLSTFYDHGSPCCNISCGIFVGQRWVKR